MDVLIERNRIKKFALVNVQHTESSFDKVIEFVDEGFYLKDLDLSWSSVKPSQTIKLLKLFKDNCTLANVNLSYN